LIDRGYDVKIFEKNREIRSTACGEGCDEKSLKKLPFDYEEAIAKKVKGIKMFFGKWFFYVDVDGIVLNRQKWLEKMAHEFLKRGGEIEFSKKVEKNDNKYIYINGEKEKYEICIGADGPFSVIKEYFGNTYNYMIGCQYEIEYDTENMDYLEFYTDRKFSHYYAWIFPKEKSINVGLIGKFSMLDKFLRYKNIKGKIIKKTGGAIPVGSVQRIADKKVALIGDAACLTNPFSLGGLSPIIYAAEILARNINDLEKYEKEIKKHPILNPVLIKGMETIFKTEEKEMEMFYKKINGKELKEIKFWDLFHLLWHPSTLLKMYKIYKAFCHSLKWGW